MESWTLDLNGPWSCEPAGIPSADQLQIQFDIKHFWQSLITYWRERWYKYENYKYVVEYTSNCCL
jgi:hypothetical protein